MLGCTPYELQGEHLSTLEIGHEALLKKAVDTVAPNLPLQQVEFPMRNAPDGMTRVEATLVYTWTEAGANGLLCNIRPLLKRSDHDEQAARRFVQESALEIIPSVSIIKLYNQLIIGNPAEAARYAGFIGEAVNKVEEIIKQMRRYSPNP
jgi:hypothetical protein